MSPTINGLFFFAIITCTELHTCRGQWQVHGRGVCLLAIEYRTQNMARTEHQDTTVGRAVSVESVHADPVETGLQALSGLTHWDILGTCYTVLWRPGIWHKTRQTCTGTSCNSGMLLIFCFINTTFIPP